MGLFFPDEPGTYTAPKKNRTEALIVRVYIWYEHDANRDGNGSPFAAGDLQRAQCEMSSVHNKKRYKYNTFGSYYNGIYAGLLLTC